MERLAEPDRQREMAAAMEAAKWQNIPTWKRKVLQRKEAQAMLPALKQQAIDNYWKQRAQELSHMPNFKREVMIKKEKEEVRLGIRRLPPEIFKDIQVPGTSEPAPRPHQQQQQQQAVPVVPPEPVSQSQTHAGNGSGVFLPSPPPV